MAAAMSLAVSERLFGRGQGKNPGQLPRTHISQFSDAEVASAAREVAREELLAHVRLWHLNQAWVTHPQHTDLDTYLREVAGYTDLEAIRSDISWALSRVSGCA